MAKHLVGLLTIAIVAAGAGTTAASEEEPAPAWRETARDVWIDGTLDRAAVVLVGVEPSRMALFATRDATEALVVDVEALTVERMAMTALALGERGWESEPAGKPRKAKGATAFKIDEGSFLLNLPDRTVVIAPHDSKAGPIEAGDVFATVPSWEALYEGYEPAAEAVTALESYDDDVELTLVFATWCGDSKREVPRLLKSLDAAGNDGIAVELISLHDFDDPVVRERGLTNVPTLIVSRDGREIGRVVETPTTESLAGDLAQILAGDPLLHPGRWPREERLAAGRYSHRDATGREFGIEDWELYALADGGTLLHAWSDLDGRVTDVWHRRTAGGDSTFVEITRTHGEWHSRTRHNVRNGRLRATTRGNGTGSVTQNVRLDEGTVLVSPAAADVGRDWALGGRPADVTRAPAMVLGAAGKSPAAYPTELTLSYRGRDAVSTPAGPFQADLLATRYDGVRSEWWLDVELGLPVRGRAADGAEVVLIRLERGGPATAAASTPAH